MERLAGEMNFPWLMSNVKSTKTGHFLASGKEYHIIQKGGRKASDFVTSRKGRVVRI